MHSPQFPVEELVRNVWAWVGEVIHLVQVHVNLGGGHPVKGLRYKHTWARGRGNGGITHPPPDVQKVLPPRLKFLFTTVPPFPAQAAKIFNISKKL